MLRSSVAGMKSNRPTVDVTADMNVRTTSIGTGSTESQTNGGDR